MSKLLCHVIVIYFFSFRISISKRSTTYYFRSKLVSRLLAGVMSLSESIGLANA